VLTRADSTRSQCADGDDVLDIDERSWERDFPSF